MVKRKRPHSGGPAGDTVNKLPSGERFVMKETTARRAGKGKRVVGGNKKWFTGRAQKISNPDMTGTARRAYKRGKGAGSTGKPIPGKSGTRML